MVICCFYPTQNPWLECNVNTPGVQLARRQSGGGAVYHVSNF